jgi:subtilisin family serine protease
VVAILDTGCGVHPWFDFGRDVVTRNLTLDGHDIGYNVESTDPETFWDQAGALDGMIDPLSGHGTFIAGLVHQACPDAEILSWRVVPSMGPIVESDWITALAQIAELNRRGREGGAGGRIIDVLSLSMGYYHETAYDSLFDPTLFGVLSDLASHGTLVVCSAGNDATARPCFPAAFAPWREDEDGNDGSVVHPPPGQLPILSVGALNPNLVTDALFSNAGEWVRSFSEGAAVMSTVPGFQGGLQPVARAVAFGRVRENIDPDDFRGGFGVWSGTSFAAPLMAGRLAQRLRRRLGEGDAPDAVDERARDALKNVAGVTTH